MGSIYSFEIEKRGGGGKQPQDLSEEESMLQHQHRLESGTKHSLQGCGNLSLTHTFKILREAQKGKFEKDNKWARAITNGIKTMLGRCANEDVGPQGWRI